MSLNKFNVVWVVGICCHMVIGQVMAQTPRADSLILELSESSTLIDSIELCHQLHGALVNSYQQDALRYSQLAFDLSTRANENELHGQSYFNLGHALFVTGQLESFRALLLEAIDFLATTNQEERTAAIYRNLAVYGEVTGQPDSSLRYIDRCINVLGIYPDSSILGDAYLSKGFAYRVKGHFNLSVESLLQALRIFEKVGTPNQIGYANLNLGIAYALADRKNDAIQVSEKACEAFLQQENLRAFAQTKNNLGLLYNDVDAVDQAIQSHQLSIQYAKQTGQDDVLANNYWNLSRLYFDRRQIDSSRYALDLTKQYAELLQDSFLMGGVHRWLAKIAFRKGQNGLARRELRASKNFPILYHDPTLVIEANEEWAELHDLLNEPALAYPFAVRAYEWKDSTYTLKKDQQIEELQLIYETEKKDAEIELLTRTAQLRNVRIASLTIGILLLALTSALAIYVQFIKRKKEKELLIKQKEIESQKRIVVEQDLEFKQRELTAKALQLAQKNEFLQHLASDVTSLSEQLDSGMIQNVKKLGRTIDLARNDEEEWEQFTREFSSVHNRFMDNLHAKHGNLTKSEFRLVTLLRMGLSSKDIANILHISTEGIKKARYRLRKKLGLESSEELEGYLTRLSS